MKAIRYVKGRKIKLAKRGHKIAAPNCWRGLWWHMKEIMENVDAAVQIAEENDYENHDSNHGKALHSN